MCVMLSGFTKLLFIETMNVKILVRLKMYHWLENIYNSVYQSKSQAGMRYEKKRNTQIMVVWVGLNILSLFCIIPNDSKMSILLCLIMCVFCSVFQTFFSLSVKSLILCLCYSEVKPKCQKRQTDKKNLDK